MESHVVSGTEDVADLLAGLIDRREDAFMQLMRRDGTLIGVGVQGGKITNLQCGAAEGRDVLPLLREIQPGDRLLIWPPRAGHENSASPSVRELQDALGTGGGTIRPSNGPVETSDTAHAFPLVGKEKLTSVIGSLLRPYTGPMTDILCDEVLGKMSGSIARGTALEIVDALAANLRDARAADEFKVVASEEVATLFS